MRFITTPEKRAIIKADELSKDLVHLRNQQFMRDNPQYPSETQEEAVVEIAKLKPRILKQIIQVRGLDNMDRLITLIGNSCTSDNIHGLDLTELLR